MRESGTPLVARWLLICVSLCVGLMAGDDGLSERTRTGNPFTRKMGCRRQGLLRGSGRRPRLGSHGKRPRSNAGRQVEILRSQRRNPPVSGPSLALDPASGDLWAGTMKGLSRYSAGAGGVQPGSTAGFRMMSFFGVAVENRIVADDGRQRPVQVREKKRDASDPCEASARALGLLRRPTPRPCVCSPRGGGVLEFDVAKERWLHVADPDGEMEISTFSAMTA